MPDFDLAIIGGGVNGTGIARDAAGRGARVLLVEKDDLASGTSSASTKLVHGGLRYLELKQFRLVRESLAEREVLLRIAPHIIRPMRFVLPHHSGMRPAWMLRLGLLLYDHLGGRRALPASASVDLAKAPHAGLLRPEFNAAFEYSDCWVDDSRLVVLNAVDAAARGASVRTRTTCVHAARGSSWRLRLQDGAGETEVTASALVNAAGPWVAQVAEHVLHARLSVPVRLVKGSHIVVPKLFSHDRAYLLQASDGRVVFAIPYEENFTLVGTTDLDFEGDLSTLQASPEEIGYLCEVVTSYFRATVTPDQVVWSYAGVRPLYDDGAARAKDLTRDYVLTLDAPAGSAPLLTIYGGKITTFRRLAEAALAKLSGHLKLGPEWTATAPLPGGDFPRDGVAALVARAQGLWPFLDACTATRLVRAYGTRLDRIFGDTRASVPVPPDFVAQGLLEPELQYLVREEFARTSQDVLWRRSKLGLHLPGAAAHAVARALGEVEPAHVV